MRWLLCDYGEVLSLPQPDVDRQALEATAGREGASFWNAYWKHRYLYDRGDLTTAEYWTAVLGSSPQPLLLEHLVEVDIRSWVHPNERSLASAQNARERGLGLAILSNAPFEVAAALDSLAWLTTFSPRLYSCRLGAVKPEPAIYAAALEALGARPDQVTFLDDRPANVTAAIAAGMSAELFTDPAQIAKIASAYPLTGGSTA